MNRRTMIKAIGAALCAGAVPKFVPELLAPGFGEKYMPDDDGNLFRFRHNYDSMVGFARWYGNTVIRVNVALEQAIADA